MAANCWIACYLSCYFRGITKAVDLLHGQETDVFGDAGYQGIEKRAEAQDLEVQWHIAMRPGKRRVVDKTTRMGALKEKLEKLKASIRAKVEHPFRVIKCQFGYRKTRYRGLAKNTAQLITLFALSNLWMVRKRVLMANGWVRPKQGESPRSDEKSLENVQKESDFSIRSPKISHGEDLLPEIIFKLSFSDHP